MIRIWIALSIYAVNALFAENPLSIVLTIPMLVLVLFGLYRIKSKYVQVGDVFWFCAFIFFAVSPLQRMEDGVIGGIDKITYYSYEVGEYTIAMAIAFLFLLPFAFVKMEASRDIEPSDGLTVNTSILLALNILGFAGFVLFQGGLGQVLSSRLEREASAATMGSELFLAVQLVSAVIIVAKFRSERNKLFLLLGLVLITALMLVSRNPFNASRFTLLAAWVPFILAICSGRLKAVYFYVASLFSLLVLFPILSITTRVGVQGLDSLEKLDFGQNFLTIPFVDIFDTTVHAVRFMSTMDWMLGQKTLAVLLFFVPRALWPGKPIVGGLDIGYSLYNTGMAGTPNLSFFLGADFYMDFGLFGVLVGGITCAALVAWTMRSRLGIFYGNSVLHYVIIASIPILMRGPVGAILSLLTCQVFVIWVLSTFWRAKARAGKAGASQKVLPFAAEGRSQ